MQVWIFWTVGLTLSLALSLPGSKSETLGQDIFGKRFNKRGVLEEEPAIPKGEPAGGESPVRQPERGVIQTDELTPAKIDSLRNSKPTYKVDPEPGFKILRIPVPKPGDYAIYQNTIKNQLDIWISNNCVVRMIRSLDPSRRTLYTEDYTAEGSKIITLTRQRVAALLKAEGKTKLAWKANERPQRTFRDAVTGKLMTELWPDIWPEGTPYYDPIPKYPEGDPLHGLPVNEAGILSRGEFNGLKVKPDGTFDKEFPLYKATFEGYDVSPKDGKILTGIWEGDYLDSWGMFYVQTTSGRRVKNENLVGLTSKQVDSNGVFREGGLHNWKISRNRKLLNGPLRGYLYEWPRNGGPNTFRIGPWDLWATGLAKISGDGDFSFKISAGSDTGPELASGRITYEPKESDYNSPERYRYAKDNIKDWNERIDASVKQQKNSGALKWRKRTVLDSIETVERPPSSNNQTSVNDEQQQIQDYIAFYTACQANVSSLIFPILQNMLHYPHQSDLLRIAAASIYSDLTRSYMLISSPFWQGTSLVNNATFYDNSTLVSQARAQNLTVATVQSMVAYDNTVVQLYLEAWAKSMALLNQTTLLADMDRVAGFLNPADKSLLPEEWTTLPGWDPDFDAFFPGGENSTSL